METESSLPCWQEPATSPYPEPAASSKQVYPPYFLKIHSNSIHLFLHTSSECFSD
jgi:hypothetical protein